MPSAIYCIGVTTVVLCIHEQCIVAVNVYSGPSRPGPIKVHDSPSVPWVPLAVSAMLGGVAVGVEVGVGVNVAVAVGVGVNVAVAVGVA